MVPLFLAIAGVIALGAAIAILRSFGPGYRVGRLLAVAPAVPISEARRLAASGEARYVRVAGRVDSEAEFEDADHRPLVLRRTTIAWRPAGQLGSWRTFDEQLEAVPFVVREGLDEIAVDGTSLADGLVVVARESVGEARDLAVLTDAGIAPEAPARLRVEYVSTVDHATVLGVPAMVDGVVTVGPGLGRPLVVSTLEDDEAMRVLAGGAAGRARLAMACLVAGTILLAVAALWWLGDGLIGGGVATIHAATPDPTQRPGSDTRSGGGAPGFVGEPLLAVAGVIAVALASLFGTLAYVRLTRSRVTQAGGRGSRGPGSRRT